MSVGEREGGKRSIGGGGDKLTCNYQTNRVRLFVLRVGTCFISEKKLLENAIIHYLSLSNQALVIITSNDISVLFRESYCRVVRPSVCILTKA